MCHIYNKYDLPPLLLSYEPCLKSDKGRKCLAGITHVMGYEPGHGNANRTPPLIPGTISTVQYLTCKAIQPLHEFAKICPIPMLLSFESGAGKKNTVSRQVCVAVPGAAGVRFPAPGGHVRAACGAPAGAGALPGAGGCHRRTQDAGAVGAVSAQGHPAHPCHPPAGIPGPMAPRLRLPPSQSLIFVIYAPMCLNIPVVQICRLRLRCSCPNERRERGRGRGCPAVLYVSLGFAKLQPNAETFLLDRGLLDFPQIGEMRGEVERQKKGLQRC